MASGNEDTQVGSNRVVNLLNDAAVSRDSNIKLEKLRQVQEFILHRDEALLDNFLDEMLAFQNDTSPDVRKFILAFTEAACKKDAEVLPKIAANVGFLLNDENVNVRKKVLVTMTAIYPIALKWASKLRTASNNVEQTWEYLQQMKEKIVPMIDDENEGIRTYSIKFVESCILALSNRTSSSQGSREDAFSLDQVPRDHKFISYRKLEAEGKKLFEMLLNQLTSQHITSVNLMTCMGVLSNISKQRPEFIEKTILAFEGLHVNLPPTLAKSQVSSVRKALKTHLLSLLKHPSSAEFQPQMTTLLTDLGATQVQVLKALPASSELGKRMRRRGEEDFEAESSSSTSKKTKIVEFDDEDEEDEEMSEEKRRNNAIDITAEYLHNKLSPSNVADLVLLSMIVLPDAMPPQFQSSYTPIAAAGTEAQIRHLARLMSTQFTALGFGPGVEEIKKEKEKQLKIEKKVVEPPSTSTAPKNIEVVGNTKENVVDSVDLKSKSETQQIVLQMTGAQQPVSKTAKRFHQFGLAHITKPMKNDQLQKMTISAFERILNAEKRVINGGASSAHMKILVAIASQFNTCTVLQELLEQFILSDQKGRSELAVLWVYHEYGSYQKFHSNISINQENTFEKYDKCLTRLLTSLYIRGEHKESLFHKLLLEAPHITPNALDILKQVCVDPTCGIFGLTSLREMILTRPRQRNELLYALLDFTCFEKQDIRQQSLDIAKELYQNGSIKDSVHSYVLMFLKHLLQSTPPNSLFGKQRGRPENPGKWEEDSIKSCLYLYFSLLPIDNKLIFELADVYVKTSSETKRIILRLLETPIKAVKMHSPDLLSFVENFPPGAETLVTKIVHLLTERNPPTLELVKRVRDLYLERVPDVRFLIPVLTGLNKREIVAALPKLIRLNLNVVKEVFFRLLHGKSLETGQQPLTPTELMVSLLQIESNTSEDTKCLINASNMLLVDKNVYTKEVLVAVIQHLVDVSPLPTLLMRTVLQTLNAYPSLIGFVMNILQRLIMKQVWKQAKVWEGFVKCCQKTKPQSFQVLLQLPAPQLKQVFDMCPDLKIPLISHISALSAHQQSHIPQSIMKVLQSEVEVEGQEDAQEVESSDVPATEADVQAISTEAEEDATAAASIS